MAGSGSSNCFIATAAYGSFLDKHVVILRNFRDAYLLTSDLGRTFVDFYYRTSPPLADFIAKHDTLRMVVRVGLTPVVAASYIAVNTSPVQKMLLMVLLLAGIMGVTYVIVRRRSRTAP